MLGAATRQGEEREQERQGNDYNTGRVPVETPGRDRSESIC